MTHPHRHSDEPRLGGERDEQDDEPTLTEPGAGRRSVRSSVLDSQRRIADAAREIDVSLKRTNWVWPVAATLVVLVILGAGIFYGFQWGFGSVDDGDLPMVTAEAEPIKAKPESPGGLDVPHQDVLVLNQTDGEGGAPTVERLLPPPETPEPLAEPEPYVAAPETSDATASIVGAVPQAPVEELDAEAEIVITEQSAPEVPETPAVEAPKVEALEAPKVEAPEVAAPSAAATADSGASGSQGTAAPAAPAETVATKPSPPSDPIGEQIAALPDPKKGDHLLQLGAFTDQGGTEAAWSKLRKKFPDLLGDMSLFVQKAQVSGKTYYRLQTGPFPNRATALDLCAQLKAREQDCLVVRR